ncbi:hypothetical protein DPMN_096560 [Dreissena polymorpha]|uniref:Uncharacterized protein n=1 Tax=Dreissena polymorpha TaxID=45954 RepID=A0A9D4LBK7_DREPO|nr:hypothetical protein DPMN_096560 [Dreissena polymorpha]
MRAGKVGALTWNHSASSHFQSHLLDSCVMVSSDNTLVVAYIQAQGGNTHALPVSGNQELTHSLQDPQHLPSGRTHTRSSQCPGRKFVSQSSVTSIRVDTS